MHTTTTTDAIDTIVAGGLARAAEMRFTASVSVVPDGITANSTVTGTEPAAMAGSGGSYHNKTGQKCPAVSRAAGYFWFNTS